MTEPNEPVVVRSGAVLSLLLMMDAMFLILHLLSQVVVVGDDTVLPSHDFLNLDVEVSFPTWWQQTLLVAGGAICLLISGVRRRSGQRDARRWVAVGWILVYLSVDEGTQIHEGLIAPMQEAFDISSGPLYFAWVIPGIVLVGAFIGANLKFWYQMPSRPRLFIGLGGAAYVVGALGVEMLGGAYKASEGVDRGYALLIAAEETLEMVGLSLFVYGVLCLLQSIQDPEGVTLRVVDG